MDITMEAWLVPAAVGLAGLTAFAAVGDLINRRLGEPSDEPDPLERARRQTIRDVIPWLWRGGLALLVLDLLALLVLSLR